VKIRICPLKAGNTSKKKVLEAPILSECSRKKIVFNIIFQNNIFLLKIDFAAVLGGGRGSGGYLLLGYWYQGNGVIGGSWEDDGVLGG
jgi:hypothetical protein